MIDNEYSYAGFMSRSFAVCGVIGMAAFLPKIGSPEYGSWMPAVGFLAGLIGSAVIPPLAMAISPSSFEPTDLNVRLLLPALIALQIALNAALITTRKSRPSGAGNPAAIGGAVIGLAAFFMLNVCAFFAFPVCLAAHRNGLTPAFFSTVFGNNVPAATAIPKLEM